MPEIAELVRAAHYLGMKPWELAEEAMAWTAWANAVMDAENQAVMERLEKVLLRLFGKKS